MKMEQTERSETSAYKIQTPGNYPKENIQQTLVMLQMSREPKIAHVLSKIIYLLRSIQESQ